MIRSRTLIAVPPGATIKEQLEDRGMTQKEFAARMDLSQKHISHLINGDVALTPDVAMRLEMVLGLPAHFWNNLESLYREKLMEVKAENEMDQDIVIVRDLPYSKMVQFGWISNTRNPKERVINCRRFFEVVRLDLLDLSMFPNLACRRLNIGGKRDYALMAWAQRARLEARNITVEPISLSKLKENLSTIRSMTTQPPEIFCSELCSILASCGIALVFLPHIGGSFLHGATFMDGNKIVLGITVRGKDADRFWFSLFHEFGHILQGHTSGQSGTTEEDEARADGFARNTLIPDDIFYKFTDKKTFSKAAIISFAQEVGIDPGIVVGRLQKEKFILYSYLRDLKTEYILSDSSPD